MTTIFPLYDFTKQIAKDKVNVVLILPPGVEPHSFEPTTRTVFDIHKSDLFIYTGDFLEIWAAKVVHELNEDKVTIVNSSDGVSFLTSEDHDDHEEDEDVDSHESSYDPHIWIDPYNAMIMVDNILKGLIEIDPENQIFYEKNAKNYKLELEKLDTDYQDLFIRSKHKTIIFGGHFVFGYLAHRYDINYQSPYSGFSPDTQPTPRKIQELINLINSTGAKTIFYEDLIDPRVAEVISTDTGIGMLPLNGGGNVSKEDLKLNISYLSIMYQNIENLKMGLEYNG